MPYTEQQRKAAFAELGRRRSGSRSRMFRGMSTAELDDYAHSPKEKTMAKDKFPDFFKKGGKKKGRAPMAADQAEALRMNGRFDKKKKKDKDKD